MADGPPNEFLLDPRPAALRLGLRTLLLAAVAAMSVFDPVHAATYGPFVGTLVFLTGRPGRLRIDAPVLLTFVLVLLVTASTQWSTHPDASWVAARDYAAMAIIFIATRDAVRTIQQMRVIAYGYVVGCAALVYTVWDQSRTQGAALDGGRLDLGTTLNINYAGYAFVGGFAMVALLWGTHRRTPLRSLGLIACAAMIVLGIFLSDTRGALVGLGIMAAWILVCWLVKRPPMTLLVTGLILFAAAIATGFADQASLAYETALGRATGDWSGRLIIWPIARQLWGENFLLGTGAATFRLSNSLGIGAHDLILELGTGIGIVGVLIYVAILWTALGKRAAGTDPRAKILIGCFLAASAASYLTGHWELAPASWIGVALFSRLGLLDTDPEAHWSPPDDEKPKPVKNLPAAYSRMNRVKVGVAE